MRAGVSAGAGFLLAVLWFDLMFDVQLWRYRRAATVPDEVISSIAAYYRRVTTDARPMNRLVALVMVATLAGLIAEVTGAGDVPRWAAVVSEALAIMAIGTAVRTVRNAVRLGARTDPLADQVAVARLILRDHLFCIVCIGGVLGLQLLA